MSKGSLSRKQIPSWTNPHLGENITQTEIICLNTISRHPWILPLKSIFLWHPSISEKSILQPDHLLPSIKIMAFTCSLTKSEKLNQSRSMNQQSQLLNHRLLKLGNRKAPKRKKIPIFKKKRIIKSQRNSKKITEDRAKLMPVMFFLHFQS